MALVERAPTIARFKADPIGRWVVAGDTAVVWCASRELCGSVTWGRPTAEDVAAIIDAYDGYRHPDFAPRFDVVQDGRRIQQVLPDALKVLVAFLTERREEHRRRIRMQIGVIPDTIVGITLTGILPVLGSTHEFALTRDAAEGFVRVAGEDGRRIAAELDEIVESVSGTPPWLTELRAFMLSKNGDADLDAAANALRTSTRTLQRLLKEQGTSFSNELARERFEAASRKLRESDAKVSVIARDMGLSERGLEQLVRRFAGCSPAELRKTED